MGRVQGKVALVTGAGLGLGRATSLLLAKEGAKLVVTDIDEKLAAQTAAAIGEAAGEVLSLRHDVSDPDEWSSVMAAVEKKFGRLDVLVNNAAFQLHADRIEDIDDARLQETLQTNIAGYFHMARAAVPHLPRGGSIINTGSETGLFGSPKLLDYSATKGAIHAWTKSLASHLLERGIRVNCVAPGPVWTPLNPADKPAEDVAKFGEDSDMGRPAQPEEISPAYVFLASPVTASYVNGVVLPVMGGPRG